MKYFGKIGEFTLELLQYASDEDIRIFLENCSKFLVPRKVTEDMKHNGYYKRRLLNYLYEYIFAFCELKLKTTYPIGKDDVKQEIHEEENYKYLGNGIDIVTKKLTPLYLHLYALCECYQSYTKFFLKEEVSGAIDLTKINKNKKNILNLLINNYTENNFYYSFDKKNITKYQIASKKSNEQTEYKYITKKYPFLDISIFAKETPSLKFQDVRIMHIHIVEKLRKHEYCKWCYPNPTNSALNLCDNCMRLSSELKLLKESIDVYEYNTYIDSVKKMNFNNILTNIKLNKQENIKILRTNRKNELKKIINKLETEIKAEINDLVLQKNCDEKEYYKNLLNVTSSIKSQISISFN